jgi:hypothetical protein
MLAQVGQTGRSTSINGRTALSIAIGILFWIAIIGWIVYRIRAKQVVFPVPNKELNDHAKKVGRGVLWAVCKRLTSTEQGFARERGGGDNSASARSRIRG